MVAKRKLAVFDLDGTLIHYEHDHFFNETLRVLPELGYPHITLEDLRRYFENFDYFGFVPKEKQRIFEERFWDLTSREHYPSPREIAGAVEVLGRLIERDVKVAVATARTSVPERLMTELRGTGLQRYIHFLSTKKGDSSVWYDKVEQLKRICSHLYMAPLDSFMVGDVPPDIWSAKKAGYGKTVAVLSGGIAEHILRAEEPDHLISDISEMKTLIDPGTREG